MSYNNFLLFVSLFVGIASSPTMMSSVTAFMISGPIERSYTKVVLSHLSNFKRTISNRKNHPLRVSGLEQDETTLPIEVQVPKVDRVSICMGELCKCQEEGNNAESILADLESRNLPFSVEDAPCLGACGVGAMVSIEYENGDYNLVTGLEETLSAIGLSDDRSGDSYGDDHEMVVNDNTNIVDDEKGVPKQDIEKSFNGKCDDTSSSCTESANESQGQKELVISSSESSSSMEIASTFKTASIEELNPNKTDSGTSSHDAVNRMRARLKTEDNEETTTNPWINMAMYIGKKMTDGVFK